MVDSDPVLERLVIESVDSHQTAIVHFLQHLIRAPSLTGQNAHGADEWVSVDELITATRAKALTMVRWCGVA